MKLDSESISRLIAGGLRISGLADLGEVEGCQFILIKPAKNELTCGAIPG